MKTPMMHPDEYSLIANALDGNKTKTMLEWGSGTSTTYFSQFAGYIDSIEHDQQWAIDVRAMLKEHNVDNVTLHEVPWNSPRPTGGPTQYHMFEDYVNYVDKINKKYDVVLIDGRARFWCAEKILPYLNDNAVVFIHDYFAYQPHMLHETEIEKYNMIPEWYEVVDGVRNTEQTIVKLKKK